MAKKKVEETKQEQVSLAGYVPNLQKKYKEEIVARLQKEFGFATVMQVPKLVKITLNQGAIAGQKAVTTYSRKDISNFKLRRGQAIGVKVTLRGARMYEFLERLIAVSLPRIRDFNGINEKFDGRGNYTLGIKEQIIFPEIDIDKITKIFGLEITFVTSTEKDEEAYALLREFGLPFKNKNRN